jgi:hypothetical protein
VVLGALAAAGCVALAVLLRGARGQLWHPAVEAPEAVVVRALEARRELRALGPDPRMTALTGLSAVVALPGDVLSVRDEIGAPRRAAGSE